MPISHSTHHATTHSMLDMTRTDWKRKGPRTTPHVRWHGLKTMGFSYCLHIWSSSLGWYWWNSQGWRGSRTAFLRGGDPSLFFHSGRWKPSEFPYDSGHVLFQSVQDMSGGWLWGGGGGWGVAKGVLRPSTALSKALKKLQGNQQEY